LEVYLEKDEITQIAISVVAISFAFTLVFAGIGSVLAVPREFIAFMMLSLVTVGSGFVLHEMGHKLVAISYGAQAKFRMWTQGLVFMLITSLFGFLFAAPGAVYIYSNRITTRQNGIISVAGPIVNIILVLVFIGLALVAPIRQYFTFLADLSEPGFGMAHGVLNVWLFGASINLLLALFNMIPASPLDGSKVFRWSKAVWVISVLVLLGFGSVLISPFIVVSWGLLLLLALIFSKLAFG